MLVFYVLNSLILSNSSTNVKDNGTISEKKPLLWYLRFMNLEIKWKTAFISKGFIGFNNTVLTSDKVFTLNKEEAIKLLNNYPNFWENSLSNCDIIKLQGYYINANIALIQVENIK